MTSDELDELIEKAVAQFCQIEGVEPELAERLVEQGILSFDDLSVMEIDTLVATIEGLDEALAETIVGKAEELAEQEEDTGPRRKGAKAHQPAPEESLPSEDGAASLDDLLASPEGEASEAVDEEVADAPEIEASEGIEATEEEGEEEQDDHQNDAHDRALAEEASGRPEEGHEVTSPPDEEDLTESQRLFEEAEETGWTATAEAVADEDEQPSQAADPTGSTGPSE
jgi:N utilization substance protein A